VRLNREQITAAVAFLLVVVGLSIELGSAGVPGVRLDLPDLSIPRTEGAIAQPEYRRFTSRDMEFRNPFNISGGWRPLGIPDLQPPPYPDAPLVLPLLERSPSAPEAGFLFEASAAVDAEAGSAIPAVSPPGPASENTAKEVK
jgi:hypothetical protein